MSIEKKKISIKNFFDTSEYVRWAILVCVTTIFTVFLYPNLIMKEQLYEIGDVAERDIKATKDFLIEDHDATEASRRQAMEKVMTVYDHNSALYSKLNQQVNTAFSSVRAVFYTDNDLNTDEGEPSEPLTTNMNILQVPVSELVWKKKAEFEEKLGVAVSDGAFRILEKEAFSQEIANYINQILSDILENGVVTNKELFLKEIDKGIILRDIRTKTEAVVSNLKQFYGLDQAKAMVRIIGQPLLKDLNYTIRNMIVDFTQGLLQPNITLNRSETEERKKKVATEIEPVFNTVKAGEMLLREGERVTKVQLMKLSASQARKVDKNILASCIGLAMLILCILLTNYILYVHHQSPNILNNNKNLLFIASVLITFFIMARISASLVESVAYYNTQTPISTSSIAYGIPLASGAMTICLFIGLELAIPVAMLIAVGTAIIFQNRFDIFIYFVLNCSMAAYWMQSCRDRKVFIKAGLKLGLLNVILVTAINAYIGGVTGFKLLWDWAFAFLGGLGAGIVTAGIAPLVEIAFDYTTDIQLLELANLDQPILRKLMIEAPGTYHHSVVVGSMVEAAASEIGANPLLAKVCGYYHDIGKIKKPMYFIENQTNGINKHDKLAPSMSSLILISHVRDGVDMAKKYKLGAVILDTIKQSHGTSLISFFYEKAKQLKGADSLNIDDFRYPGPKPQTKEAGLVMLADMVEAASRVLANPTPSRIQGLVQHLINTVFSDGQLDECELTLKDLNNIAKSFNKILYGIHHHRIEYPEKALLNNTKGKDESPDRQQAKKIQDISEKNSAKGKSHLKRLGLS
ncbi:MAG: HDIG domain-containing protein [Desulfobacterales bacterium]|nr:MAG: HDIG domain-containing protein [Desulfobacterales bacterium]